MSVRGLSPWYPGFPLRASCKPYYEDQAWDSSTADRVGLCLASMLRFVHLSTFSVAKSTSSGKDAALMIRIISTSSGLHRCILQQLSKLNTFRLGLGLSFDGSKSPCLLFTLLLPCTKACQPSPSSMLISGQTGVKLTWDHVFCFLDFHLPYHLSLF